MDNCVFCKIVQGAIPCQKVLENDNNIAFYDIKPYATGHALVIPKDHYRWTYDIPNFADYWQFVHEVTQKIMKDHQPSFISFLTLGNEVPHAHVHIIPRYDDDRLVNIFNQL